MYFFLLVLFCLLVHRYETGTLNDGEPRMTNDCIFDVCLYIAHAQDVDVCMCVGVYMCQVNYVLH